MYEVINNIPSTTMLATGFFNYTPQNEIADYTLTSGGDTLSRNVFEYDADGYLVCEVKQHGENGTLYAKTSISYYYTNTLGTGELKEVVAAIYPNPAKDKITILTEDRVVSLQILDLTGKTVLVQTSGVVDISHLPDGNYILIVNTVKGAARKLFVKHN